MVNDKRVIVLLSTYNGEKYVEQQLESIFNQTYRNTEVFVRDDGSTDSTVRILREFEKKGKIRLVCGENLGYVGSFNWLLSNAASADYFSFADQDDVWLKDKIERAVIALGTLEPDKPALYFGNFDYYDKDLNFISHKKSLKTKLTLKSTLLDFKGYGFTCVINNELKRLFLMMEPGKTFPHDYLSLLIGTSMGNIVYEKEACAKYRRHDKNASVFGRSFIKFQIWRVKNFLLRDKFGYKQKFVDFFSTYGSMLNEEDRKFLKLFINTRYRIDYALKKAFYPTRYRENLFDELAVRILAIIGRL